MKNKGVYRLLSGVLCTSVLLSSQVYAATPADYSDFPQNWSKDAMTFAVKNNYITGVSEDKIAPKAALTRAQLAAILSRVMKTGAGDVSVLDNFNDADKNAWYAGSMAKAVELNILYGDGDSIYPDRPVTRQELFTILVRAFSVTGGDESALAPYSDAGSVSSWARAAISAMIAQGYAAGYEDKTIRPTQQVTREEFAQLLYRMQEFYGSSDSSDNKTETKTDETTKTDGKTTSGGGGGGSSSGGGSHGGSTVTANKIVDEAQAKVQPLAMGTWLPLVFEDGFNTENVTVTVDGTDVTSAMSKVTTDGTIAKLPLRGTPNKVVVTSGSKTQTINLNGSGTVYTGEGKYLPDYVLAHGAVAVWDYHQTNYDKDGVVRTKPGKTTFDLKAEVNAHPYYSPDTVLKESEDSATHYVSGEAVIMFNYNTAEEKAWFDGIQKLELKNYDSSLSSLNSDLKYTAETNVEHYGNNVAVLKIPVGQSNFFNNQRYYVSVKSNGGDKATVLVPVHLVQDTMPTLVLKDRPQSGQKVYFDVKNMTYGITSPIESVTLKGPNDEEAKELKYIDDYFLFGNLFVLYNDNTNNIPDTGNYTITIHSNGFKDFGTTFYVSGGNVSASSKQAVAVQSSAYDVVTHATGSSGGSGSDGSSGGSMMSADLLFDTDLLANALLLDKIGVESAAAAKIADMWYEDITAADAVMNLGATTYYKYANYQNAVGQEEVKANGPAWLPFAEYTESDAAVTDPNRPYAVKSVLEDGLLGETQYNGSYNKKQAPTVTVSNAAEGDDVVLSFEDEDYFQAVEKLYINGDWKELSDTNYHVDADAKTITIDKSCFKIGENTVGIEATGYAGNTVKVDYNKVLENVTGLTVTSERMTGETEELYTVKIAVDGSEGDFLTNLQSIVLTDENNVDHTILDAISGGTSSVYYVIAEDKKSVTLYNVEPGTYTISVSADYYKDALTADFTIARQTDLAAAPTVAGHEKKTASGAFESTNYYRLTFNGLTGDDLSTYLRAITKVTVGNVVYEKEATIFGENNYRVKASDDTQSSTVYDVLDLAVNGIDAENGTQITVEAKGYAPMTYTLKGDSTTVTPDPDPNPGEDTKLDVPTVSAGVYQEAGYFDNVGQYRFTFKGMSAADLSTYLQAITGVTVEGVNYAKFSGLGFAGSDFNIGRSGYSGYDYLDLAEDAFKTSGETTITVEADGYKTLTFKFDVTNPIKADAPAAAVEKLDDTTYCMTFANADATEVETYLNKISSNTTVKVGENTYSKVSYKSSLAADKYCVGDSKSDYGSTYDCIYFYANGFATDAATTITIDNVAGYNKLECTYTPENTDNGGGDNGNNGDSDNGNNGGSDNGDNSETGITVKDCKLVTGYNNYYHITFDVEDGIDLVAFVNSITEVKVGETDYQKANYSFDFGDSKFGFIMGEQGNDSLKLATNGFNTDGNTEIVIKGTLNGEEVTITFTYTAE